jgi:arginyl-tRNA synthetase
VTPDPINALADAIAAVAQATLGGETPVVELSAPAKAEHGDLATPVAMGLARAARRSPREIADDLRAAILADPVLGEQLDAVEVAGPGFLNLRLSADWFAQALGSIHAAGEAFGAGQAETPMRVLLEFVSPNPTGPLHVGHARGAAYGDGLGRILTFAGHEVWRESYMNDYGRQMALFGESVAARYGELVGRVATIPEDGYHGEYVIEIARALGAEVGDEWAGRVSPPSPEAIAFFSDRGSALMLDRLRADLDTFRVRFDQFASERALHESGEVERGVAALEASGETYWHEEAMWFRTTDHGDEKDRVLVRADGTTTYLAADVAYHLEKASRGHDLLIDVLGADHHGYIGRLRAVLSSGGRDPDMLEVVITQLVSLVEHGETKKMSKRAGTLVELTDLVADIGVDAARFLLVQRSHETALDLDMEIARKTNDENPVFYVQYVHARIRSILARPEVAAVAPSTVVPKEIHPAERALILRLAQWPEVIREAELRRGPHRIVNYLIDVARDYHGFYHDCPIIKEPRPPVEVQAFRIALCEATATLVRTGLDLVGVAAPDSM